MTVNVIVIIEIDAKILEEPLQRSVSHIQVVVVVRLLAKVVHFKSAFWSKQPRLYIVLWPWISKNYDTIIKVYNLRVISG